MTKFRSPRLVDTKVTFRLDAETLAMLEALETLAPSTVNAGRSATIRKAIHELYKQEQHRLPSLPEIDSPVYPTQNYIYGLVDPYDHKIYYVGCTEQALKIRLGAHCSEALACSSSGQPISPKNAWIIKLLEKQEKPLICLLGIVPFSDGANAEKRWILKLLADGAPLTNVMLVTP